MIFLFDPLAKREYDDAYEYYDAQEAGLGEGFRKAVWSAMGVLQQFPQIGEEVRPGIRKILLRKYPYKLIYAASEDTIYIIALAHGHREPDFWLGLH